MKHQRAHMSSFMKLKWSPLALLTLSFVALPVSGQRLPDRLPSRSLPLESPGSGFDPLPSTSDSYWLTGGIIGTALGSIVFFMAPGADSPSRTVKDALLSLGIGAAIGGVPGALIGSLFKKHREPAQPESVTLAEELAATEERVGAGHAPPVLP